MKNTRTLKDYLFSNSLSLDDIRTGNTNFRTFDSVIVLFSARMSDQICILTDIFFFANTSQIPLLEVRKYFK